MKIRTRLAASLAACGLAVALGLGPGPAHAQFLGANATGDYGLLSGSQPDPGLYVAGMYYRYDGETLRDAHGESVALDPAEQGSLDVNAYALGLWWVTDFEIFGGKYGLMIFPALTDNKLEIPIAGTQATVDLGFTDLYVQPINLGWKTRKADFLAGFGVYIPTGRYAWDADDNLGLGMWTFELDGGGTLYFDEAKTWNFATMAHFEMHTDKKDTSIRVGNILTLEGGLGKSFMEGGVNVGVAYYAQWKLTHDDLGEIGEQAGIEQLPKHRGFGVGPDVTIPIATSKKLIALLNARYFWEMGNRTTLEGRTLTITATFPIPSVPLM